MSTWLPDNTELRRLRSIQLERRATGPLLIVQFEFNELFSRALVRKDMHNHKLHALCYVYIYFMYDFMFSAKKSNYKTKFGFLNPIAISLTFLWLLVSDANVVWFTIFMQS